jgi:hypothetical protein
VGVAKQMKRISITGNELGYGKGAWFDADKAESYKENSYHDGNNWISKATHSQWEHEAIYVTKGGKFILNSWSNWQGSVETYELVSKEYAGSWFAAQDFQDDEIPEIFREEVAALEID